MGAGLFLALQSFETTTPFASATAFGVGSLAVIVTTTFYSKRDADQFYREVLVVSTVASFVLFLAGIFGEVVELTSSTGISVPTQPYYASLVSSLFIVGSIDLLMMSTYLLRFGMSKEQWARLTGGQKSTSDRPE